MAPPPLKTLSDADLVSEHRAGDPQALSLLVERHLGVVYLIALSALQDRDAAEDLVQEASLRALLALPRLEEPGRFSAWFAQIARNLAVDWLRTGRRSSRVTPLVRLDEALDLPDPRSEGARRAMVTRQEEAAVREALWQIEPQEREVLLLHFAEGLSQSAIATRLGVNRSTVHRQLRRALGSLREGYDRTLAAMAPSLRLRREAAARTAALVCAAASLPLAAQGSLAVAAGIPAAVESVGFLTTVKAALAAGGKTMAMGKGILATFAVSTVIYGSVEMRPMAQETGRVRTVVPPATAPAGETEESPSSVVNPGWRSVAWPPPAEGSFVFEFSSHEISFDPLFEDRPLIRPFGGGQGGRLRSAGAHAAPLPPLPPVPPLPAVPPAPPVAPEPPVSPLSERHIEAMERAVEEAGLEIERVRGEVEVHMARALAEAQRAQDTAAMTGEQPVALRDTVQREMARARAEMDSAREQMRLAREQVLATRREFHLRQGDGNRTGANTVELGAPLTDVPAGAHPQPAPVPEPAAERRVPFFARDIITD